MTTTPPVGEPPTDHPAKVARVRRLLAERGAGSIVLSSPATLSWLLDGARVSVPTGGPAVLSVVVSRDDLVVHAFANEVERLAAEELRGLDLDLRAVPWAQDLPAPPDALAEEDAAVALRELRAALLPRETARYERLGRRLAELTTDVAHALRPETTERAVAADLAHALVADGIEPIVLLVAGESRTGYRHPLPTAAALGRRAMLVVGGRRHGLFGNLTRWLQFGSAPPGTADRDARLLDVEADVLDATMPGRPIAEVFAELSAAYARHGFPADSWLGHHQGGATGYAGRDPRATPGLSGLVAAEQAFAWNPSVPHHKVEDTVIAGPGGVRVLTHDPRWPAATVRGRSRPRPLALD